MTCSARGHSMVDPDGDSSEEVLGERLPKVAEVPLARLLGSRDSALDRAVKRVLHDIENFDENYAAFGNVP